MDCLLPRRPSGQKLPARVSSHYHHSPLSMQMLLVHSYNRRNFETIMVHFHKTRGKSGLYYETQGFAIIVQKGGSE